MNTSNASGVFDQAKGKVKEVLGETFNDQKLANEGAADQVKGHAEEAWGNLKDTASHIGHNDATDAKVHAENTGHDLRSSITNAAEHVKESISRGLGHLENKNDRS